MELPSPPLLARMAASFRLTHGLALLLASVRSKGCDGHCPQTSIGEELHKIMLPPDAWVFGAELLEPRHVDIVREVPTVNL